MPKMKTAEENVPDLDLTKPQEDTKELPTEFMLAPGVKTIVRTMAPIANHPLGIFTVEEVDNYLTGFRVDGWELKTAESNGRQEIDGNVVIHMVYVLVR